MSTILVQLPDGLRDDLKEPFGPVYTDAGALLADAGEPIVAVGDVVTAHLERAGRSPDVAVTDGKTERTAVEPDIRADTGAPDVTVTNPPAAITDGLATALVDALDSPDTVRIRVDGEEDLAALPAILAAPEGASVVYGQPGEGMVLVRVTPEAKAEVRGLVERMDGAPARLLDLVAG